MKKLMIAAAIVCAAIATQAASIQWGGDICEPDGLSSVQSGTTLYLLHADTMGSAVTQVLLNNSANWQDWTANGGWSIVASHTLEAIEISNYATGTGLTYSDGAAATGYYAVIAVDGAAGADGLTGSYNYAGYNSNTDPLSSAVPAITVGDGWASDWIGVGGFDKVSFTNVPEPTSGLLLLLGMAGLALKRKRA